MNYLSQTNEMFLKLEGTMDLFGKLSPKQIEILNLSLKQLGKRPYILNIADLGWWTGIDPKFLYSAIGNSAKFYRKFKILKANGSYREIAEPLQSLKYVQRWLLDHVLVHSHVSVAARAYVKGRGIRRHLKLHQNQETIVGLDVRNFFQSIRYARVKHAFLKMGYLEHVAAGLAHICCLNGGLPQGAPTSAALSNIIMRDFDEQILSYCKTNGWRYSRYADDLAFSGTGPAEFLFAEVRMKLSDLGLKLNHSKSRVMTGTARALAGVMLTEKLKVKAKYKNEVEKSIYTITKFGLEKEAQFQKKSTKETIYSLVGKIKYINYIEKGLNDQMSDFLALLGELDQG